MKNFKFILFILLTTLVVQGCEKKEKTVEVVDDCQITMNINGKNYKSISFDRFDSQSESTNWEISSPTSWILDKDNKYEGESSVKMSAVDNCSYIQKKIGLNVVTDKMYLIHFYYKMAKYQIGDKMFCSGLFMLALRQGDEIVLQDYIEASDDWNEKIIYFQPKTNIPIQLEVLVGNDKGVWLDELMILEEF